MSNSPTPQEQNAWILTAIEEVRDATREVESRIEHLRSLNDSGSFTFGQIADEIKTFD